MARPRWAVTAVAGVALGVVMSGVGAVWLLANGDPSGLATAGTTLALLGVATLTALTLRTTRRTAVGLSSVRQHSQRMARRVDQMTRRGTPVVAADLTSPDGVLGPLLLLADELPQMVSRVDAQQRDLVTGMDETLAALEARYQTLSAEMQDQLARSTSKGGEIYRLLRAETSALYSQVEGLLHVLDALDLIGTLPPLGGWAIRADLAAHILRLYQYEHPQQVVEAGSGVSTVILAAMAEKYGEGHVTALEHDPRYAERTRTALQRLQLTKWATVVAAPLMSTELNGEQYLWYDLTNAPIPSSIDLLLIDGPPGTTGPMARYPAVPLLHDRLSEQSVVLLDDARRHDEQECVKLWQQQFGCSVEHLDHLVGTAELRFPVT